MKFRWHKIKNDPEYYLKLKGGWKCVFWRTNDERGYISISRNNHVIYTCKPIDGSLSDQKVYCEKLIVKCIASDIKKWEEYVAMMRAEMKDFI